MPMTAREALFRLRDTYRSAAGYRDRGRTVVFRDNERGLSGTFATTFVRSRGLSFQFEPDTGGSPIVIRTEGVRLVEFHGMSLPARSLDQAIAFVTGVTGRAAQTVPRMLLPDAVSGPALWDEA